MRYQLHLQRIAEVVFKVVHRRRAQTECGVRERGADDNVLTCFDDNAEGECCDDGANNMLGVGGASQVVSRNPGVA